MTPIWDVAEDQCRVCGRLLGYGVVWLHVGLCEECRDRLSLEQWPLRVSRWDAIAMNDRDEEYVVHAARRTAVSKRIVTRCGRYLIKGPNEHPADSTRISCMQCDRLLFLDARDRSIQ
jgi:hypothetical protein